MPRFITKLDPPPAHVSRLFLRRITQSDGEMGNEHGKIKHVGLERFNRVWDRACGEQGDDSLEVVQVIKVLGKVVPSLSKEEAMTYVKERCPRNKKGKITRESVLHLLLELAKEKSVTLSESLESHHSDFEKQMDAEKTEIELRQTVWKMKEEEAANKQRGPGVHDLQGSSVFDDSLSVSLGSFSFQDLKSYSSFDAGSCLVILLHFLNSETNETAYAVVKGSPDFFSESYALSLAREPNVNISAPSFVLVKSKTPSWDGLFVPLLKLMEEKEGEGRVLSIQSQLKKISHVVVMQYLDAEPFQDIPPMVFEELFMGDEGERRLRHLGRLMAFDLAVNNFDRLPLVWGNKGNFGNIMVSKDEKRQMIGIDFGVNPIKKTISGRPNESYERYFSRVRLSLSVILELNSGSDEFVGEEAKEWFKGLKVAFLEKVGYKLSQHDIKMLQIGVIEGVDRLCSVSERQLISVRDSVNDMLFEIVQAHYSSPSSPSSSSSSSSPSLPPSSSPLSFTSEALFPPPPQGAKKAEEIEFIVEVLNLFREIMSMTTKQRRVCLSAPVSKADIKSRHCIVM